MQVTCIPRPQLVRSGGKSGPAVDFNSIARIASRRPPLILVILASAISKLLQAIAFCNDIAWYYSNRFIRNITTSKRTFHLFLLRYSIFTQNVWDLFSNNIYDGYVSSDNIVNAKYLYLLLLWPKYRILSRWNF